jgi:hypothetical protein
LIVDKSDREKMKEKVIVLREIQRAIIYTNELSKQAIEGHVNTAFTVYSVNEGARLTVQKYWRSNRALPFLVESLPKLLMDNKSCPIPQGSKWKKLARVFINCSVLLCERSVGTVFQLPNPDAIYSRDEGKERRWLPFHVVCVRAQSTHCWGKVRDRREGSD